MYGLAPELKIEGLIDSDLQQICVGKYDVQFQFSSGTLISVQSTAMILKDGQLIATWTENCGWDSHSFHDVINTKATNYSVVSKHLLAIFFENDFILELIDDSDQYESMQIYPAGDHGEMIVV